MMSYLQVQGHCRPTPSFIPVEEPHTGEPYYA